MCGPAVDELQQDRSRTLAISPELRKRGSALEDFKVPGLDFEMIIEHDLAMKRAARIRISVSPHKRKFSLVKLMIYEASGVFHRPSLLAIPHTIPYIIM